MDARSERVRRGRRKAKAARNLVRAQHEMAGWEVTPRSPRKAAADFEAKRFNWWTWRWEHRTVKAQAGNARLTKKQTAEKRRVEKAGGTILEARVRSLW